MNERTRQDRTPKSEMGNHSMKQIPQRFASSLVAFALSTFYLLAPSGVLAESRILKLSPDAGPATGGTVVRITVEDLSDAGSLEVRFGDRLATNVRRVDGSSLEAATPAGSAGPVPVLVVSQPSGTVAGRAVFTYTEGVPQSAQNPVPQIISLKASSPPRGGAPGTLVVAGSGFRPESVIQLDKAAVRTEFRSAEELVGTIPSRVFETSAALTITVSTPGPGGGTSNVGRLVVEIPPIVGRYVVFTSNRRGGRNHLFLFDRATGLLDPLEEANSASANDAYPSISADGRFIVFQSDRKNRQSDIYLFDRETRTLDPLPEANNPTAFDGFPKISPDGRVIIFESDRLKGKPKVFLFDRAARTTSELQRINEPTADDGLAAISN